VVFCSEQIKKELECALCGDANPRRRTTSSPWPWPLTLTPNR